MPRTSYSPYRTYKSIYGDKGRHVYFLRNSATKITAQSSATYFLGDPANDSLQRIYGISFPAKKQLDEYKVFLAEAAKRDHRKIGKVIKPTDSLPRAEVRMDL